MIYPGIDDLYSPDENVTITLTADQLECYEEHRLLRSLRCELISNKNDRWETDLQMWLNERFEDLAWTEESGLEERTLVTDIRRMREVSEQPFDHNVRVGDIRIAPAEYCLDRQHVSYFCVANLHEGGSVLLVPFSPYKTPAVLGEIWSAPPGESTGPFNLFVLQGWNAMEIPIEVAAQSWLCHNTPEMAHRAHASFCHIAFGDDLPEIYKNDTGPPILDINDPRRLYQDEYAAYWEPTRFGSADSPDPRRAGGAIIPANTFIPG